MDIKRIVIYSFLFVLIAALASQGFTQLGLVIPLILTFVYFTAIFIYAQILKNNSIVDIGWGMGFVIGSWVTLLTTENPTLLSYLVGRNAFVFSNPITNGSGLDSQIFRSFVNVYPFIVTDICHLCTSVELVTIIHFIL